MAGVGRSGADLVLVAALAAGATYEVAAEQGGVSERMVRRRMEEPSFRRQVEGARAEILARAVAMLTSASVEAVEALRALLGSDLDSARLGAAKAILETGLKMREQLDLVGRIAALEEAATAAAEREKGSRP